MNPSDVLQLVIAVGGAVASVTTVIVLQRAHASKLREHARQLKVAWDRIDLADAESRSQKITLCLVADRVDPEGIILRSVRRMNSRETAPQGIPTLTDEEHTG